MTDEEIRIARSSMTTYTLLAGAASLTPKQRTWYQGAAAAVNDLMCRLGAGEAVADLADKLAELEEL